MYSATLWCTQTHCALQHFPDIFYVKREKEKKKKRRRRRRQKDVDNWFSIPSQPWWLLYQDEKKKRSHTPSASSKLCHNWLRHLWGTFYSRVAVHRRCQRPRDHLALRPQKRGGLLGTGTGGEEDERVKARPRIPLEKDRRDRGPLPEQWKC